MEPEKTKIAIASNGKMTVALALGLLNAGFLPYEIIVIGREKSNLSLFEEMGIQTSREMNDAQYAEFIFLMVTPQGLGPQLSRFKNLSFNPLESGKKRRIVSLISGSTTKDVGKFISSKSNLITHGTANTNIAYGKGIICIHKSAKKDHELIELLSKLGKVRFESSKQILKSIVTVGANNAFDLKMLEVVYESLETKMSLRTWLEGLQRSLNSYKWKDATEETHKTVYSYLAIKVEVFRDFASRTKKVARKRALETLQSSVDALLETKSNITLETVQSLRKTVVTNGGCTEKGINKIVSVGSILCHFVLLEAFLLVWERTKEFKSDVAKSIAGIQ